jgi:hypothetical protein
MQIQTEATVQPKRETQKNAETISDTVDLSVIPDKPYLIYAVNLTVDTD